MAAIREIKFKNSIDDAKVLSLLDSKGVRLDEDLLTNDYLSEAVKNHLILNHLPEIVEAPKNKLDLFYSKYYWLSAFNEKHKKLFGEDAGLEQQLFKLCEEAESSKLEVDWNLVEKIEEEVNATINH